ncbi:MAG TPA: hypothetical protein VMH22_02665 [bacterium]|nr:hypothetical protein [bacterium]
MARRPVEVRVAKWTAKMKGDAMSPAMERKLEHAGAKYTAWAELSVQIEISVRGVLNGAEAGHPVPMSSVPSYLAFAQQVAKVRGRFIGDTASAEIENLKTSWAARGIDPVIMARIVEVL